MAEETKLSGLEKAAILFKVLGPNLARPLFKSLNETDIMKIRSKMDDIGNVSFESRKKVLEEFYFNFMSEKMVNSKEHLANPFAFLNDLMDEQILLLLREETAKISAIALAQLPADRVAKIITRLDPETQGQVMIEMGHLVDIPLEGIESIASDLAEKALGLPKFHKISTGGSESLAELLDHLDVKSEKQVLDMLSKEDPQLAKDVKKSHFTFEDLSLIPDNLMRELLRSIEASDIALALKGQPQEFKDKLYNNLPERAQIILEDELRLVEGPQPRRLVQNAQQAIVDKVKELQKEGKINMADILESDMIE
ncbi:MAG: hypothetical protein IIB94_00725 [Candidatus Marinimicrobia bacterium]|nr:hypothetical protein [Candidatus Neomarinimicrobiota bacterium]